jgi:hypothetical protein
VIHTTVGVYPNWRFLGEHGYKTNGVLPEHLESHIEYNKTFRWGRALFVDGKCVYPGSLGPIDIAEWESKLESPGYTLTKCTAPYE